MCSVYYCQEDMTWPYAAYDLSNLTSPKVMLYPIFASHRKYVPRARTEGLPHAIWAKCLTLMRKWHAKSKSGLRDAPARPNTTPNG